VLTAKGEAIGIITLREGALLMELNSVRDTIMSVFTIIEGECFRINEGVAGDPGWSWRVVTAERV
jgi:hypothetical protein